MKSPLFIVIYLFVIEFRAVFSVVSSKTNIMCDCLSFDHDCKSKCMHPHSEELSRSLPSSPKTDTFNSEATSALSSRCILENGVTIVPIYVLYIIGILMLLMFVMIIYLSLKVCGGGLRHYNFSFVTKSKNNRANTNETRTYTPQTSMIQEVPMVNVPQNDIQETILNENCRRSPRLNIENELSDDDTELTRSQQALKIYKSTKKPLNHQLLLREQMKKICEDALAKSQNNGLATSLRDLNNLFAGVEQRNLQPNESEREKSASYPILDIYDEPPPKNIPVDHVQPLYDCLPTSNCKNIVVEDYDTQYLLPISKDDMEKAEYINAQYRFK